MGIYDRGYMGPGEDSPYGTEYRRRFTAVSTLIIINIAVWVLWQFARHGTELHEFMDTHFMMWPRGVLENYHVHTLLTAAFSHIEIMHLLFNMLFLWFLGTDVEQIYGYRNFIVLYVFAGVFASAADVALDVARLGEEVALAPPALGASGAIMGIAVVAAIFDPDRIINIYGIIPIKLKWLVAIYVLVDLVAALDNRKDHIGHVAHLAGALAGFLFWKFDLRVFGSPGRSKVGLLHTLRRWFRRKPSLRVVEADIPRELPREAVAQASRLQSGRRDAGATPRPSGRHVDAETSQRVDQLLSKISEHGIDSLTDEERAFLQASSQKYRQS